MTLSAALLHTTLPAADQSLLEVTDVGYSGAPNLFYNDGPAKKFSVDLTWNGATAVRCPFPEIRFSKDGGAIADQTILVSKDGERDVTLQPGDTLQRFFRINEVSFRHNKKV
jgi:hypothetical protein